MKNKNNGIQYLRGYAALLVVFNHLWSIHGGVISETFRFDIVGGFGVDIFFVISGFIMACTLKDVHNKNDSVFFIKKRVCRIYPLHLFALVPALLFYIIRHNTAMGGSGLSVHSVIGSVLLLPDVRHDNNYAMINPVEWTLVYEMTFYLALSMFMAITRNKRQCLACCSVAIILVVFFDRFLGLQGARLGWVNLSHMLGDTVFIDFIFGFLVYVLSPSICIKLNPVITFIVLLLITAFGMMLASLHISRLVAFGIPSFFIVMILATNQHLSGKNKCHAALTSLGSASYSIYLTHHLFLPVENMIASHLPCCNESDVFCSVVCVAAVLVGILTYTYIEQPYIRRQRRATSGGRNGVPDAHIFLFLANKGPLMAFYKSRKMR